MKALINRIIECSNVDGPGNRMAIFFQGCPFSCWYCHNPETIKKCSHCGICVPGCPTKALSIENKIVVFDQSKCVDCDQCIKVCPNNSSPKAIEYTIDELMLKIEKYKYFIRGITVSGGECMNYPEFITELFQRVKDMGLTCLIDSNGFKLFQDYPKLMELCDGVMLDVKASNSEFHRLLTYSNNDYVLENLKYLQTINKLYEVRTVLLNEYDQENRNTIEYIVKNLKSDIRFKLIGYRPYGVNTFGKSKCGDQSMSEAQLNTYKEYALELGHKEVIVI